MKKRKLKIAIFCTNEWPTPPPQDIFYAPLWIAYYIAEGLAKKGHQVFYFGSKESRMSYAKLYSFGMKAVKNLPVLQQLLKADPSLNEKLVNFYEQLMLSKIYQLNQKEKFDIIHIHPYRRILPLAPLSSVPVAITIHDPVVGFAKYILEQTKEMRNIYLISISDSQRKPSSNLNYAGTAYNGIDTKKFNFNEQPEDFFLVAGRFVPDKGIDIAVQVARQANIKLKIAGGPSKGSYFETKIKPYLSKNITYLGMINYYQMTKLYQKAKGLLYPLRWQEPFGLVMVEAMAAGCPVIAFNRGSVPELVKDGKTGFIVRTTEQMVKAVKKIDELKRKDCREWVENNFSKEVMVQRYEELFLKIVSQRKK